MGSDRRRRAGAARLLAALAVAGVLLAATPAVPPVPAAEPWWVPVGLRGEAVATVVVTGGGVLAGAGGRLHCLRPPAGAGPAAAPDCRRVAAPSPGAGRTRWRLRGGRVDRGGPGPAETVDPGSPDLGPAAHLLAAPAALPGVVVAVAADGTVWRRTGSGSWGRALILLPRHLLAGPPAVTALSAFESTPLTAAAYLGTDGYAVLVTSDGGDDWLRAGPGLPAGVLALATDAGARAVYAGTRDGLWVHHVRALPAPPVYRSAGLLARWLGIAAISLLAVAAAVLALARAGGARRAPEEG
jgi:hypothetical protein